MYTDLIFLTLIIVFITDLSGVVSHIETALAKWLKVRKVSVPLLTCSLCQTWWAGLIYLLITHNFTLPAIAFVGLCSYMTTTVCSILTGVKEAVDWVIVRLTKNL